MGIAEHDVARKICEMFKYKFLPLSRYAHLTLKGRGFFVYLKSGGGGRIPPPLGSRPRSDEKFWNLAHT